MRDLDAPLHPDVSVVIPTRNRWNTLVLALSSVLHQRDVALEVIVVDEASTDGTNEALDAVARHDARVRVVRHTQPMGLAAARNAGLREARGRWVAFLDDDDFWHPAKLSQQVAAVAVGGTSWTFGSAVYVDDRLRPFHIVSTTGVVEQLLDINSVPAGGSGVLASREVLLELGGFDVHLSAFEDWDCWLRLLGRDEPAITSEVLTAYRIAAGSMSHSVEPMEQALSQMAERHPDLRVDTPASRLAYGTYFALQHARSGRRRASVQTLLKLRPLRPLFLVQALWVAVSGTAWTRPVWARTLRERRALAAAGAWIPAAVERAALLDRLAREGAGE